MTSGAYIGLPPVEYVPCAPTNYTVRVAGDSLILNWTAPVEIFPIAGYKITMTDASANITTIVENYSGTTYTYRGTIPAGGYDFTLTAVNCFGQESAPVSFSTMAFTSLAMGFIGGNYDPTNLTILNLSGSATAVVQGLTLVSGTFDAGNAAGWFYLTNWNGKPFDIGTGTLLYILKNGSPLPIAEATSQPIAPSMVTPIVKPPNVTGLQVVNQGEGNLWITQDLQLTWTAVTVQEINPNLPAGSYQSLELFTYIVQIYDANGITLRRQETAHTNYYDYTYTKNCADGAGVAATEAIIKVYAQGQTGAMSSSPAVLTVSHLGTGSGSNVAPSTPTGLIVAGTKLNIYITWNINPDASVMNYEVGISTDGGSTWPTVAYTSSEIYTFPGVVGTTYTVRLRAQSYTGLFSPYSAAVSGTLAGISGATDIIAGTLTADRIATGQLIVGTNVTMGANATISWGQVTGQPGIPNGTYINGSGIYTGTINCNQINTGTLSAIDVFSSNFCTASDLNAQTDMIYLGTGDGGSAKFEYVHWDGSGWPRKWMLESTGIFCDAYNDMDSNALLSSEKTGWGEPTGTLYRAALTDASTQTQFNHALMALITDLYSHGLIHY